MMATAQLIHNADSVVTEIVIASQRERVFQALIDRAQALQWGSSPLFRMIEWEMDARVGGKWSFASLERRPSGQYAVSEFVHCGEILKLDPPKLLEYTWFANWHSDPAQRTVVRWELTPVSGGTRIRVTHSGLAAMPAERKGYSAGWPGLLAQIKNFVETNR